MKRILIDLDLRTARDLERVAPARARKRAEFVRLAIRRAVDLVLDRETAAAYGNAPLEPVDDLTGWDPKNALTRRRKTAKRKAA